MTTPPHATSARPVTPSWHTMDAETVVQTVGTDAHRGLTADEARKRLDETGRNVLRPPKKSSPVRMFLSQFNDVMVWVLMVAVAISAFEGELPDAIAITAILVLNAVLGFIQEYRAERSLEALEAMSAPSASVIRDGEEREIAAAELVPGDVVLLEAGDRVPADGRLVEVAVLQIDEASLTGESVPVHKQVEAVGAEHLPLGDRVDMVFAGTAVAVGRGRMVVTETGQATEMGRVADLLAAQGEPGTPLQRELHVVGKRLAVGVLAVAAVVFAVGVWQAWRGTGAPFGEALALAAFRERITVALLVAISLAVAAIPEGLPAIVTVSLSLGVRLMAAHNAIVRKLHAVETLGSTTFICSDKTGTLTANRMRVERVAAGLDEASVGSDWTLEPRDATPLGADLALLLEVAASCNDARVGADGALIGDPTETALLAAAEHLETTHIRRARIAEVPFDSARKRMTTLHGVDGECVAYSKGGVDVMLGLCARARVRGEVVPLDDDLRTSITRQNERLASEGYRTLALAMRPLEVGPDACPTDPEVIERDLVYLGLVGLLDPPRPEVMKAIETCHRAGINVAMVTGDHALTARAVGSAIGLLEGKRVVTGSDLAEMDDEDLESIVEDIRIYARVDPEHKLRIVDALKRRGHVVAMTGDGVNDAPALKRADIGVAMGQVGTDVSREAADMVLADDNFATIVEAVRQGRIVFDNLRKFILFLLSCNVSEVLIIFVTTFFASGPALLPLQILWINLVTDGLPALALGVDPPDPNVMSRTPRGAGESILARGRGSQILWQGALLTLAGLTVWIWGEHFDHGGDPAAAQSMLFTTMVLAQLLHAFNFRSRTLSVFSAHTLTNRWLIAAILGSLSLQMLVVYLPPLQRVFSTHPLDATEWFVVVSAALVPLVLIDAVKVLLARKRS